MTPMTKPVRRVTSEPYKHYRRQIVVELAHDTIIVRLKGTRSTYVIPVAHLLDDLCRRKARQIQAEKRARRRKKH